MNPLKAAVRTFMQQVDSRPTLFTGGLMRAEWGGRDDCAHDWREVLEVRNLDLVAPFGERCLRCARVFVSGIEERTP